MSDNPLSRPNPIPEITDGARALCAGDASRPDATPEVIAREKAIHTGLAQDVPGDFDPAAPLLRASLAATPEGVAAAKRWGQSLAEKRGTITPDGVAASKPSGQTEIG